MTARSFADGLIFLAEFLTQTINRNLCKTGAQAPPGPGLPATKPASWCSIDTGSRTERASMHQ